MPDNPIGHLAPGAPDCELMRGHTESPFQIPWRGWKSALRRTLWSMSTDRMSLVAAGCAFYATLSLFPAISMLVFLYGLVFSPATVEPQLAQLKDVLPASVLALINARVRDLVERPSPSLGLGLAISTTIALWTATTGTKAMLSALNFAYDETEHRGILTLQLVAIAITLSAIMVAVITLAVLVVVPALVSFVGLSAYSQGLLRLIALLLLLGAVMLSLSTLYRYGPSRHRARWRWVRPGAGLATGLWLVASVLFSEYVARIAGYDATYGPLAAAVGVMMWLWVSVYVVLLGAQLNAELELLIVPHRT